MQDVLRRRGLQQEGPHKGGHPWNRMGASCYRVVRSCCCPLHHHRAPRVEERRVMQLLLVEQQLRARACSQWSL